MPSFFLYVRKSTEESDRQVASIPAQLAELHAFATARGLSIGRVFEESQSARRVGRPIFGEMMRAAEKHPVAGILCWKADRLARNALDGGQIIDALDRRRVGSIVTVGKTFHDTSDDKLMLTLEFGMSKKYVDDLADNVRRGNRAVVSSGRSAGNVPLGYLKEPPADRTHGRGAGRTIPDPERFAQVREIFQRALTGRHSAAELYRIARDELGLRSRGTRRCPVGPISLTTIHTILANPFYMGLMRHGGDLFPGGHEPMVTKPQFDRIQKLLHRSDRHRPSEHVFTYRGLLCCGCGRGATAETHAKPSGLRFTYYRCSRRWKDAALCSKPYLPEREVESALMAAFEHLAVPPQYMRWALRRFDTMEARADAKVHAARAALHRELEAKGRDLDRLTGLAVQGLLTGDEFLKAKTALLGERMELEARLADPKPETTKLRQLRATVITATEASRAFREAGPEERRRLASELCEKLVLREHGLAIELLPPFAVLAGEVASKGANPSFDARIPNNDRAIRVRRAAPSARSARWTRTAGANPPGTSRIPLHLRESRALGTAETLTYSRWWTRVLQVGTLLGQPAAQEAMSTTPQARSSEQEARPSDSCVQLRTPPSFCSPLPVPRLLQEWGENNDMRIFVTNELEAREMIWARLHHLPPMGYTIDVHNWRFEVDETLAPLVRLAWKLAARGQSVESIFVTLNEKGFRTPTRGKLGGKPLQRSALYKLLTDPFYAGFIRDGDRCCAGYHEAIVTVKDFIQVQDHLARRRRNHGPVKPAESLSA